MELRPNRIKRKIANGEIAVIVSGLTHPDDIDAVGPIGFELPRNLACRLDIAQRPDRRVSRGEVDHIGLAALAAQPVCVGIKRGIGGRFVFAFREVVDGCPQQLVQQNVARGAERSSDRQWP